MALNYGDYSMVPTEAVTQFYCVKLSGNMAVDLNDTQGERCIGICQDEITAGDVTNGRIAAVRTAGGSRAVASAAISADAVLTSTGDGRVMTAATGDFPIGYALTAAAAANDQLEIMLQPGAVAVA